MRVHPVVNVEHLNLFHSDTSFDDIHEDSSAALAQPCEVLEPLASSEDQSILDKSPLNATLGILGKKILERMLMLTTLFNLLTNLEANLHGLLIVICCCNVWVIRKCAALIDQQLSYSFQVQHLDFINSLQSSKLAILEELF